MEPTRAEIEKIKYHLNKSELDPKPTNSEIRTASEQFESFDTEKISQTLIENRRIKASQLTVPEQLDLVKFEAQEMGVTLTDSEVLQVVTKTHTVVDGFKSQANESINFLVQVREFIREILAQDYAEIDRQHTELETSIHQMLTTGSQRVARRIADSNSDIMSALNSVNQANTDYKSPFPGSLRTLQQIREKRQKSVS